MIAQTEGSTKQTAWALWLGLAFVTGIPIRDAVGQQDSLPVISGVTARLYHYATGLLSANIIDSDEVTLFNVSTGRGSVEARARAVLIQVTVSQMDAPTERYLLSLSVTQGDSAIVFEKNARIPYFDDERQVVVPFWVDLNPCEGGVVVTVSLRATGVDYILRRVIPFVCGE